MAHWAVEVATTLLGAFAPALQAVAQMAALESPRHPATAEGLMMMTSSTLPRRQTPPRVWYPSQRQSRTRSLQRPTWPRVVGALGCSTLLFLLGAVLGQAVLPRVERRVVPPVVPPQPVVIVPETSLPPVLRRIAQCESGGQHWTKNGHVVRGTQNPQDTGLFQINAAVWGPTAAALGYDIWTREGNEQMARYLLAHYGTVPWRHSAKCWQR